MQVLSIVTYVHVPMMGELGSGRNGGVGTRGLGGGVVVSGGVSMIGVGGLPCEVGGEL